MSFFAIIFKLKYNYGLPPKLYSLPLRLKDNQLTQDTNMQDSFKCRVIKFWKSFSEEEYQIREMMDNKADGETLINFVDSILQIAFNKIYFEMGINKEGKYELILTPEGDRARLMQLHYWLQYAPEKLWEKWNFYSSKPAHGKSGAAMEMYGIKLGENDITIYPETDNNRNKINLDIFCPRLMALDESQRYSMFLIYMDQFIGELYTMEYIGYIDFVEFKPEKEGISIIELKSVIEDTIEENAWPVFSNPSEIYSGYKMEPIENEEWTLREDIFSGYSSCTPILNEFYKGENPRFDEAKENGVIFGFLFFENTKISRDNVVTFRGEIEDKISTETAPYGIASSIGGATGFHFSYLDFIIYDFKAFIPIASKILSNYHFEEIGYSDFISGTQPVLFETLHKYSD